MKRGLSYLLALALVIGVWPWHTSAVSNAGMAGDGSPDNPYIVMTLDQLNAVRDNLTASYKLGDDIDASATASWDEGAGWEPIGERGSGDGSTQFRGVFDGAGHVIRNLTINRPAQDGVGLFGMIGSEGEVRNLGMEGGSITGGNYTGVLAGNNYGTVERSYASVDVRGGATVGGLIGYEWGQVNTSYATGDVSGTNNVGGLSGRSDGTVTGSYATGNVRGDSSVGGLVGLKSGGGLSRSYFAGTVTGSVYYTGGLAGYLDNGGISLSYNIGSVNGNRIVGGLVGIADFGGVTESYASGSVSAAGDIGGIIGANNGAEMENNYWDTETSGQSSGCGYNNDSYEAPCVATGLSTAQALTQASYSGWNFTADWFVIDGSTRPFLRSEWSQTIRNAHQLQLMTMELTAEYTLASDIDFGTTFTDDSRSDMWATSVSAGAGFAPIAGSGAFIGRIDGMGHAVLGLIINRPGTSQVGLIGYLGSGGVMRNIGVSGGSIRGGFSSGGLVGYVGGGGTVELAYSTADVSGGDNVGGLVGNMYAGIVRQSYAAGDVSGTYAIGGLVGRLDLNSLVEDAYAIGSVQGNSEVGGLVGRHVAAINRAYASGRVSGSGSEIGGLAGRDFSPASTVSSGYYDAATSGHGGGKTTEAMKRKSTFSSWDFSDTWTIEEGKTYPVLRGITANLGMDVAPPAIANATVQIERPNIITVAFDEEISMPGTGGFTVKADGLDVTVTGSSKVGARMIDLMVSAALLKEQDIRLSYDSQAGSVMDLAGNLMSSVSDYWPPTITIGMTTADGEAYSDGEWTNQSVTVVASVYDYGGVAEFVYAQDGDEKWTNYVSDIKLQYDGEHTIEFKAVNSAGIETVVQRTVKIERTAPVVAFAPNGSGPAVTSATPTVTVSDSESGVDAATLQYTWTTNASPPTTGWLPFTNSASLKKENANGDWYLHVKARDRAGNESIATSDRFRLTTRSDSSSSSEPALPGNTYPIGLSGGSVPFEGGELSFPAGAMDRPFRVTIEEIADTSTLPLSDGERLISRVFEFKKDVPGKFLVKMTVKLRLNANANRQDGTEFLLCWLDEKSGKWVTLGDQRDDEDKGAVSGTTDHFTKFAVISKPVDQDEPVVRFTDLKGHWAEAAILRMARDGAVSGYPDGTFRPERPITRAEFASILAAALQWAPTTGKVFADTKNHWARDAISTAYANGVIRGYDDDAFAPDEPITREQMAVMAANALHLEKPQAVQPFADGDRISKWARDSVEAAVKHGVLSGYPDQTMRPQAHATRAEAVMVITRVLENR